MSSLEGQVADQVIGQGLKATEEISKFLAWGMKNLAMLLLALYQENKDIFKKPSLQDILNDKNPPGVMPIKQEDVEKFLSMAKDYQIKPFIIGDDTDKMVDVVVAGSYIKLTNRILEKLGYAELFKAEDFHKEGKTSKNADSLVPQESGLSEQGNTSKQKSNPTMISSDEPPSVVAKVEDIKTEQAKQALDNSAPTLDKSATTVKAER